MLESSPVTFAPSTDFLEAALQTNKNALHGNGSALGVSGNLSKLSLTESDVALHKNVALQTKCIPDREPAVTKPDAQVSGVYSIDTLRKRVQLSENGLYLVEDLFAECSFNIGVGDSGLGKSSLFLQVAICVATGVPFLGLRVRKGKVLILNYENGEHDTLRMIESLCSFLGVPVPSDNLLIVDVAAITSPDKLGPIIERERPALVLIDPVRMFDPDATNEKDGKSAKFVQMCRQWIAQYCCSIIFIHHIRKFSEERLKAGDKVKERMSLEGSTSVIEWTNNASGSRTLVNSTDTRLGVELTTGEMSEAKERLIVIRGFRRTEGEFGPIYIRRVLDEDGDPKGYERFGRETMLTPPNYLIAFRGLPDKFNFTDAKEKLGRGSQPTHNFINKCLALGLLRREGEPRKKSTLYRKIKDEPGSNPSSPSNERVEGYKS